MYHTMFVRVGTMADLFAASHETQLPTGRRVLVRTVRGVELGEVVGGRVCQTSQRQPLRVLRPTTTEDEWLIKRLNRHKKRAVESCRDALKEAGSQALLLDVDQLFDGGVLVMHFLGDTNAQDQQITQEIAAEYQRVARTAEFAKLLSDGCGPTCGTAQGAGCGSSGGCGTCTVGCGGG